MSLDSAWSLTVTDLKQFDYCPRVVFYERCLPHVRPRTYKMDAGRDAHEAEAARANRRTFSGYGLPSGERQFDIALSSERLALNGLLDELVIDPSGRLYPVDYKLAKRVSPNHRLQLAAYALLLEDSGATIVEYGYIVLIGQRTVIKIELTSTLKQQVLNQTNVLWNMIVHERMPDPTTVKARCTSCEFRRFCNDV
jgi:CRISPR-associated exonuclease Cas4